MARSLGRIAGKHPACWGTVVLMDVEGELELWYGFGVCWPHGTVNIAEI